MWAPEEPHWSGSSFCTMQRKRRKRERDEGIPDALVETMCPFVSMMCESRDVRRYVGSFLSEEEKKMLRLTCRGVGRALLKDMLEEYMWRVQSEEQLREWSEEWRARVRRVYWDSEQPLAQEQDLLARVTHLTLGGKFNQSVDTGQPASGAHSSDAWALLQPERGQRASGAHSSDSRV